MDGQVVGAAHERFHKNVDWRPRAVKRHAHARKLPEVSQSESKNTIAIRRGPDHVQVVRDDASARNK